MMQEAFQSVLIAATASLLLLTQSNSLRAQSLSNIRVGDTSSALSTLGQVSVSDSYKGMDLRKWVLPNGNELSATISPNGHIVYLESDWGNQNDDPACDLLGLHFGLTTLSEIRRRFGSNGFGFKDRGYVVKIEDSVVMINSYEVGTLVITFYTKISRQDYSRMRAAGSNPSPADYARLDAISIADPNYAKSEWGDRVYDPKYKKIEWK
jgi:hypothetical protein